MVGICGFAILLMIILIFSSPSEKNDGHGSPSAGSKQEQKQGEEYPETTAAGSGNSTVQKRKNELDSICSRIRKSISRGDIEGAETLLKTANASFPGSSRLARVSTLLQKKRTVKESAEALNIYLDSAERACINGQWGLAAVNYEHALELKDSEEIRNNLQTARFNTHVKKAETYISAGSMDKALSEYREARSLATRPELKSRADALLNTLSVSEQVLLQEKKYESYRDRAEEKLAEKKYRQARSLFAVAMDYTVSETQNEYLRSRLLLCDEKTAEEKELRTFDRLLKEAAQAEKNGDRQKALLLYTKARGIKPENSSVRDSIQRISLDMLPEGITDTTGVTMKLIRGGTFTRGSLMSTSDDCKPERSVFVSPFYIDITEISNLQYEQFDPFHKRSDHSDGDHMPVTGVSWHDAVRYCEWRSKKNNARYRLPTEAEWEKAARGGDNRPFSWGHSQSKETKRGHYSSGSAVIVTSFDPNPFGLYNMSGNVWEWCLDRYSGSYYAQSALKNPQGPSAGTHRVVRGGSFRYGETSCRTYERNAEKPGKRTPDIGFRTVRITVEEEQEESAEAEPGVILK